MQVDTFTRGVSGDEKDAAFVLLEGFLSLNPWTDLSGVVRR